MFTPEGIEVLDRPLNSGHGGARRGAGRKANDYVPTDTEVTFDKAKARNEAAKADMNELEFKIKSGQYLPRAAIQQASATAIASFAQSIRSIPDNLERTLGVSPEIAEQVGRALDASLEDLANEFRMMAGDV